MATLEQVSVHCSFYASGLRGQAENETLLSHGIPRPVTGQTLRTGLTQLLPPLQPMPAPYIHATQSLPLKKKILQRSDPRGHRERKIQTYCAVSEREEGEHQ